MQIYNINFDSKVNAKKISLAIGNFDGIHLGHQGIIKKLVFNAKKNNYFSAILSFDPHPRKFFNKKNSDFEIISKKEKINLLDKFDIDYYFSLNFDKNVAKLEPIEFISKILIDKLDAKNLTVGYDFKFGKDRKGDVHLLKEQSNSFGFGLDIINPISSKNNNEIYSSSLIRKYISQGNMEKANAFLGRNWSINGQVIEGDKRASQINFPTANILPGKLIYPKKGVYAIKAKYLETEFVGIANFGERPTIDGKKLLLEAHLFNFNKKIYGKELTVEFLTFIREEKKFDNFSLLTEQIKKDIQVVKNYHLKK